ncbi:MULTISPECIES: hypothetical protein [unclassified Streptomyces]|uniref:hypothetical protein n=1 Tax=unclassified Streptomyces TaxID=2593676 RepID=UPI000DC7739B|nr:MULTISPECIES: hypothetical protein [unclassified Streptomyces]AWZ05669.1 hypothetical protein DRB89_14535 [Streptomyces sp. ICC4]AWZ13352.1 hypothetical protein DRB96_14685 [Streptomyces sp. ICC1]
MTDTTSDRHERTRTGTGAGEAAWTLPLLSLAPVAAIRQFTGHSPTWLALAWAFCALSAVLLAAGWVTTIRRGPRRSPRAWVWCVLAHAIFAVQAIWLLRS